MTAREVFQADHAHDAGFLDAVDHELDRQITDRVGQIAANPSDYHLHILGPVPTNPDHQAIWLGAAATLERHFLGLDHDPTQPARWSLLSPQGKAEMQARVQVMAIPQDHEPPGRGIDHEVVRDLLG